MLLKEEIRNQIIENEKNELKGLESMYKTHAAAADLDEESSLSSEDFAQQDQSRESARGLELRIEQAKTALDYFISLDHGSKAEVEPGALVMTGSLNFYIGISATKFEYEDKAFIGLEPDAPIYQAFLNAKVGDEIEFNENKYKILEIL